MSDDVTWLLVAGSVPLLELIVLLLLLWREKRR